MHPQGVDPYNYVQPNYHQRYPGLVQQIPKANYFQNPNLHPQQLVHPGGVRMPFN